MRRVLTVVALATVLGCMQPAGNANGIQRDTAPLNEPPGFMRYSEQPWDVLDVPGPALIERALRKSRQLRERLFGKPDSTPPWHYLRRASSRDASIVVDSTAPYSWNNVLRIPYTAGCCIDAEPSVTWVSLPDVREIYTAWWMKLSDTWIPNPAGGGKITFLQTRPEGKGQVYTNLYHQGGDERGWVTGPPYRVGVNTEWKPYDQRIWLPNVAVTGISPGQWHRIEFYYRWGAEENGIIRWWVDGVLNGDHTNVSYPDSASFGQFEFAPTVQFAGLLDRYMDIDHTVVSIP